MVCSFNPNAVTSSKNDKTSMLAVGKLYSLCKMLKAVPDIGSM